MPTNPFDDDPPSGGTNPFENESPSRASGGYNPFEGNTNPFDNEPQPRSGGGTNPFGESNNPFDNDDLGSAQMDRGKGLNQFGSRAAGFVSNLQRPSVLGRVMRSKTASDALDVDGDGLGELPTNSHHGTVGGGNQGRSVSITSAAQRRVQSSADAMGGWLKNRTGGRDDLSGNSNNPFDDDPGTNPFGSSITALPSLSESRTELLANDANNTRPISSITGSSNFGGSVLLSPPAVKLKGRRARKEKKVAHKESTTNKKGGLGGLRRGGRGGAPTKWPFDDFIENTQYEAINRSSSYDNGDGGGEHTGEDGIQRGEDGEPILVGNQTINTAAAELGEDLQKEFERPVDLPTISEAVRDLSLVDFERKAEERAISILSMWLHDSGLIDDLLVTGTPGYNSLAKRNRAAAGLVDDITVTSVKTSEGMEVGAVSGYPMEPMKMDKEIIWLRNRVQRELALVNSRLNDGVAASGAEVQELVNSVATTKGDLGRLRQMLTYITQSGTKQRDEFLLQNCPRLRQVMNARRNLFRCFRELDFFDQMPTTCERLREELHAGEWTTDEWNTIRNVSMEHVELEILLVEAEAGMKELIDQNDLPSRGPHRDKRSSFNPDLVDRFLNPHVTNVWELGEEIKLRITAGLNTAYDLATNNPAAMVALVEAVEVYERATEHYHSLYNDQTTSSLAKKSPNPKKRAGKLKFTNMRASALATLCEHFTLRCSDVFRRVQMRAADMAEEDDAGDQEFAAILQAATELVSELNFVKEEVAPCFPPHWRVEVLWSSSIAHICSNQIIQQIGGPEGTALGDLSTSQLLDLISWVEFFRDHIEEAFPQVKHLRSTRKTYFDEKPELLKGDNKKEVDMESATDSLAWANNMLWEVHRLSESEFLQRTRDQIDQWLENVYSATHTYNESSEGRLSSSLAEDLYSLVGVQLRTIRQHLSPTSEALVMAMGLVFSNLRQKQILCRNNFLVDLESACAAANDFARMTELCEETVAEMFSECQFDEDIRNSLDASANDLLGLYSADSVYAAQSTHVYIFEPIHAAIAGELFGPEWEQNLTHNELALTLVRTIEDFMEDLEQFLDSFLLVKTVEALVSAAVVFYVRCLLIKAEEHNSPKVGFFEDNFTALERMSGDIKVMREFFEGLTERMPTLSRVIEREFEFFTSFHELISVAAGCSEGEASNFIILIHKLLMGNIDLTKHFVGDLWHLMNPQQEKDIWEEIDVLEETLEAIAPKSEEAIRQAMDRLQVPGLRLDRMMAELYVKSTRKLPIKSASLQKMAQNLRLDWGGGDR